MSDERTPKPGANAARRARRIGGRPSPVSASTQAAEPESPAAAPVRLDKREPAPRTQPAPSTVRSLPLAWFPAAVLAVSAVLLLGVLVWFSHGGYWDKPDTKTTSSPTATEQQRVLAAAKTCFATLNTYDYRTLDQARAAGLACTTGKFTSDYRAAFDAQIEKYAPTTKAAQMAQVNKAGISEISPNGQQWVLLIYGQLQTTNVSTEKEGSPRVSPVGGVLTMDCVGGSGLSCSGGKWLVAKVDVDTGTGLGS